MFCSLVMPLSFKVCIIYWSLQSMGDGFIFPDPGGLSKVFPKWLDFVFHTNIVIFSVIETFVCRHRIANRITNLLLMFAFLVAYLAWFLFIYFKTGKWAYGVVGKIESHSQKVLFFLFLGVVALFLYLLGEMINKFAVTLRKIKKN